MTVRFELYRIVVRSHLDRAWMKSLPLVGYSTKVTKGGVAITVLTLRMQDQSELVGLLNEFHARGLQLVSVDNLAPA